MACGRPAMTWRSSSSPAARQVAGTSPMNWTMLERDDYCALPT